MLAPVPNAMPIRDRPKLMTFGAKQSKMLFTVHLPDPGQVGNGQEHGEDVEEVAHFTSATGLNSSLGPVIHFVVSLFSRIAWTQIFHAGTHPERAQGLR